MCHSYGGSDARSSAAALFRHLLAFHRDADRAAFCLLSQVRTVSASRWIARVGAVSRSMSPVRSQRHIVVKSRPANPKRCNSQIGIGNRGGFLPITSRYIARHSESDCTSLASVSSFPMNRSGRQMPVR